jgi:hypothetical protein
VYAYKANKNKSNKRSIQYVTNKSGLKRENCVVVQNTVSPPDKGSSVDSTAFGG